MCQRAVCPQCGGATYQGCGNHIEQALAGVPEEQRCSCPAGQDASGGVLRRLLGRR
ncbi:hypothetical protein [Streptacidiphilus sp. PB12-B1b]|uniref:hypothetical protein n=1 Tax=Streptacidiphilus sp. PB12-B1b TaxID=2705012 RepID=UPI0015FE3FF5|nr:hypothetical protein [Streptacidiphilus sp. PB12-B1b]